MRDGATRGGDARARGEGEEEGEGEDVPEACVAFAERLATAAGEVTTRYFRGKTLEVEDKNDASPVTVADQTAESVMRSMVTKEFPTHAIFGEEHGIELGAGGSSEWTWVFDPIDGTKSFITGKPLWGTLIALLRDGEPVLGVLDQPVLNERWVGVRGRQTTMNGEPISVKKCASVGDAYALALNAAVAALRSKTTERFVTKLSPSNITKPLAAYFDGSTSPSKRA